MLSFLERLRARIKGDVLDDAYSLGMYATDASIYQMRPRIVIIPKDESDVSIAVAFAGDHKLSILPRGGGTSLAGQTVGDGLVLDFSKYMNETIEINEDERWVRVQPGIVRDQLNQELEKYGLHFAPDPATSSRANIGGMVGNNSSGTKSILYGKTVDHVLEVKILLADGTELLLKECSLEEYDHLARQENRVGEIYREFRELILQNKDEIKQRFPKVMRKVGGYNLDEFIHTDRWNLAKLITGSEGTLAVILEVKLHLEPLPKFKSVAVIHFLDLMEAIKAVNPILKYQPSAVEILDQTVIRLSRENLTTRMHCHFIVEDPVAILIVEFYGDTEADVVQRPSEMIQELRRMGIGYAYPFYLQGKEYEDVWMIRKKGLGLMLGLKGDKKPLAFIEDACVPVDVLPEYIDGVIKICQQNNTRAAMYAHASVGVIHVRPILDLRLEEDIQKLKNIASETFELVMKYGGSWSGEHGDGLVRSPFNEQFFGPTIYRVFKNIKRLLDPGNLMNPGKIVDAPPMETNLRYGAQYQDKVIKTEFSYRREKSFGAAVHMCTGVGECRKLSGGTMCPSFKATLDEEHSTRGRANALRLAMSGQLDNTGLTGERLHQVLDLCLSCKACKSECPSNVDMAKMKGDVSQMYYDEHGTKLRDRLIRDAPGIARAFSGILSGPVNFIERQPLFRSLMEQYIGFDKRRILPEYTKEPFHKWFNKKTRNIYRSNDKVVLFADTYLNYHEPQIGMAALQLLNSCGYEVILADIGCCQRPKISHGFIRAAKSEGLTTITNLKTYLDQGLKIVVCEPSCASALNDDLPDLIEDETLGTQLKSQVMMIEDFLTAEIASGHLNKEFKSIGGDILIHGHCHQKALYGIENMKMLLEKTGRPVKSIPSGCCGMAGSFGYEKEHYEVSRKIGEDVLFPAARSMNKDASLVANGFSCRHQIAHFTGIKPKHWVEVIRAV